jgi:hypothetical protein
MCDDDIGCPSGRAHVVELTVEPDQCCHGWAHGHDGCPAPATTHLLAIAPEAACTLALCDSHTDRVLHVEANYVIVGRHPFAAACNTPTPLWRARSGTSWCDPPESAATAEADASVPAGAAPTGAATRPAPPAAST